MRTVLHLAAYDLRRWWSLATASVALAIGQRVLDEVAPRIAMRGESSALAIESLVIVFPVARLLLAWVLVAVVVHETPLVGSRAFWMTRPVQTIQLLVAKLLILGPTLVVVPVVVDAVVLVQRALPLDLIALDVVEGLLGWRLLGLLCLMVVAALTTSLVGHLVALFSSALGFALVWSVVATLTRNAERPAAPDVPPPPIPDSTAVVQALIAIFLALAIPLLWQYTTRRRGVSIAILVALLGLSLVREWPPVPPLFAAAMPDLPSWARDDRTSRLVLAGSEAALRTTWVGKRRGPAPFATNVSDVPSQVEADVELTNVPGDYFAEVVAIDSRFRLAQGAAIAGRGGSMLGLSRSARRLQGRLVGRHNAWEPWLGRDVGRAPPGGLIPTMIDPRGFELTAMASVLAGQVTPDDSRRLTGEPVEYDGELVIDLWRYRLVDSFPLGPGRVRQRRARQRGDLLDVVHVQREDSPVGDGSTLSLLVRQTTVSSRLRPGPREPMN